MGIYRPLFSSEIRGKFPVPQISAQDRFADDCVHSQPVLSPPLWASGPPKSARLRCIRGVWLSLRVPDWIAREALSLCVSKGYFLRIVFGRAALAQVCPSTSRLPIAAAVSRRQSSCTGDRDVSE